MVDLSSTIATVTALLKQTTIGSCAIALAGSHAKGNADAASDLDIFLFADQFQPAKIRRASIAEIADPDMPCWVSDSAENAPWGGSMDFNLNGTPVEVNFRTFSMLDHVITNCLSGKFEIIPATWTANGYYTFVYLSELQFMQPIWDPEDRLSDYIQKTAVYPEPLRDAIIRTFMARAVMWLDNFHYASAIQRQDILFTAPIVLHTVLDMVQVVFAINRVYFNGDKKLENALAAMPLCPMMLKEQLPFLLNADQDSAGLAKQREILRFIRNELEIHLKTEST